MSAAEMLLARLEGVRVTGQGRWLARCPAHDDRSPSLSIRETDDGTLLVHDFGGCSPADVVAAVGLELRDLFADTCGNSAPERKGTRPRWNPKELLLVIRHEALVAACGAGKFANGEALSPEDCDRLQVAANRINSALEVANVR